MTCYFMVHNTRHFYLLSLSTRTLAVEPYYPTYTMSTDKELYKLELLSLVSRVSQELFNHTKLQDKNLAEFVISVCPF